MKTPGFRPSLANRSEDDEIYPLTVSEIAEAKKRMQNSNITSSATQSLIKDWKSSSLRTQNVSAKKEGWSYPSHYRGMR